MTTEVLNSFNALQNELNQAKNSLKDYDENIKKLIGRDPSEAGSRNNKRAGAGVTPNEESRGGGRHSETFNARFNDNPPNRYNDTNFGRQRNQFPSRNQAFDPEEPQIKKRSMDSSVFKRLDKPRQPEEDDYPNKPQMFSRVIVTPREVPSRQDALKAQDRDEKSKARNRRMFGALLGTLQKFRQEETKLKTKEDKRAQVEKKLEEQEIMEKAKVKKERYELFLGRKKKQQEIRLIEQKMLRIKEQTFWEEQHKPLTHFIRTTAKPHIFYLPRRMSTTTREKLSESKKLIQKMIEEKQQNLQQELEALENRYKKGDHKEVEDGEIDDQDMNDNFADETEHESMEIDQSVVDETSVTPVKTAGDNDAEESVDENAGENLIESPTEGDCLLPKSDILVKIEKPVEVPPISAKTIEDTESKENEEPINDKVSFKAEDKSDKPMAENVL